MSRTQLSCYLRIHAVLFVRCTTLCHGFHQNVYTFGLSSATGTQGHHTMTDALSFIELVSRRTQLTPRNIVKHY